MRAVLQYLIAGFACLALVSGCGSSPVSEIGDAKAAVDTVMSEGAEKYAPEEARLLNTALVAALAEVAVQEKKLLKDFSHARSLLADVRRDAVSLGQRLPEWKTEARAKASQEFAAAKNAVAEAGTLANRYLKSRKGTGEHDFPVIDLARIDALLADAHKLIVAEDYLSAVMIAADCRKQAEALSGQLRPGIPKSSSAK